jgi:ParB family chromosome partitioning protein
LSKSGIAEVLTHAGAKTKAIRAVEKGPKAEAAAEAEKLLHGTGWLPPMLHTASKDAPEQAEAAE